MIRVPAARVSFCLALAGLLLAGVTVPAAAQYRPLPRANFNTATEPYGQFYRVEAAFNLWDPAPEFVISSESLGIKGSDIDVQADLDIQKARKFEFRLTLRPTKRNKFRFHYLPLAYDATTNLKAQIVFNGIKYPVNAQVATKLQWKTYRIGYEVDVVSRARGFLGLVLEAKYTDAQVTLTNSGATEYARARAPIPALGAIGRVYITKYGSITAEFTGLKLPDSVSDKYKAHYYDWDAYATLNVTTNFGVQLGYRSIDLGYVAKSDSGSAKLKGMYFGGVARF
jgi:hypothetical protein